MEIRHFKLIVAVSRLGSLTKASDELCLSQPALSHQLKEIEEELQIRVFERENNRMKLTLQGEVVRKHAEDSLRILDSLKKELNGQEQESQKLSISVQHYNSFNWIGSSLNEVAKLLPNVDVDLKVSLSNSPVELLQKQELDLAITFKKHLYEGLRNEYLFTDELVVLVPPEHRLSQKPFISLSDFGNETLILNSNEKGREPLVELFLNWQSINCRKVMHVNLTDTVLQLVQSGHGISILPKWLVCPQNLGQLTCLSLTEQKVFVDWYLEFQESTPQAMAFLQALNRTFSHRTQYLKAV